MSSGELTPPRYGTPRRVIERKTLARLLRPIARSMAIELHPWQWHVSAVSLELVDRADPQPAHSLRRLAYADVGVLISRQTGKTTWAALRVALQCLLPELDNALPYARELLKVDHLGAQRVAFTAQDRSAALARWREHVELMRASDLVWSHVDRVRLQRGEEAVMFTNGSRYSIMTPNDRGARGLSLDLAVIDEALVHEPRLLRAVAPTMAQRDSSTTGIGAQLVIVSNAGDERARLLNEQRELGRRAVLEGGDGTRAWFEWSAPDEADPFDPEVWRATIPTLDQPDGISSAFIARQAESPDVTGFRREYLCQTVSATADAVVDLDAWETAPEVDLTGAQPVFAIDASPDGDYACIVAAATAGNLCGIEVVEAREGTHWLERALVRRLEAFSAAVAIDAHGPLGHLVAPIERAGFEVFKASSAEVVHAAASFTTMVATGQVAHRHDPRLTRAVEAAQRQRSGDRWRFNRSALGADLVVAASLACWGAERWLLSTPTIHP